MMARGTVPPEAIVVVGGDLALVGHRGGGRATAGT